MRVVIAAGGTGGHINAGLSVGESLTEYDVLYITGKRPLDLKLFSGSNVLHVNACALRGAGAFKTVLNILINMWLILRFVVSFLAHRPKFAIGAGGYVCGPPLLAAKFLAIPVYIIEQNSVMGLTNKLLAKISKKIFTHFKETKGLADKTKQIVSGNPVRSSIQYSKNTVGEKINILVVGGSLGAEQINSMIPFLVKKDFASTISIKHQVGLNQKFAVHSTNVEYEQLEYIEDMNSCYAWANIIIARAGASTISEMRIIQKPVVFIPYPKATDNHQEVNAKMLKGEAKFHVEVCDQSLVEDELAREVHRCINHIINASKFGGDVITPLDSVSIIKEEILKDVRS